MVLSPFPVTLPSTSGSIPPNLTANLRIEQNDPNDATTLSGTESSRCCADGGVPLAVQARPRAAEGIRSMINKYDSRWPDKKRPLKARVLPQKECVVVTGTTGGLGSYLLAQLLESERVEVVWALNRKSGGMEERQRASFEDKGLAVDLLKSEKLVLVEADLEDTKLGLEAGVYEEIQSTATSIIHTAWQINFRLPLEMFEPSIKGVHNLLGLAFSSTASTGLPRFLFTSSFAGAGFGAPGRVLKETYLNLEDAVTALGYGQSKFVAEKLIEPARHAGLETCIIRLGQLSGDATSGSWSTTNWVPLVLVSSLSVGYLPMATGDISWLPLPVAANSILDICTSYGSLTPPVIHLSHPYPVKWESVFGMFAEALNTRNRGGQIFPVIPFNQWNERVKSAALAFKGPQNDKFRRFPTMKIQSTIEAMVQGDNELRLRGAETDVEAGGLPGLDTTEAVRMSETLSNVTQISQEHVEKWVEYWVKMDVFHQNKAKMIYSRL
ncbi:hypothetical protein FRC08_000467 [Ceratobasidium sp. 394]|nr:hypothetical protein FRC08_000467 [Ceratobasidium sp. 394]